MLYIGIMEKKMETTILGLGIFHFRSSVVFLFSHPSKPRNLNLPAKCI